MLSHVIKKVLDTATGLDFTPVHGSGAWYKLTPLKRDYVNIDTLEVRIVCEDFDRLEEFRSKVEKLVSKQHEGNLLVDGYSLRFDVSGGGILPLQNFELYDSTQYLKIKWIKKEG